jgi:hypothetical protein
VNVYIFTGPTISATEGGRELKAIYLPPAAEGDVYRVALERPRAIGIIDGYFQSVPAVRHKEILWAMSRGIHVFGCASIGALRAAELASFGMEGIGTVFQLYRDGALEDDDEVAIVHGPADLGYPVGSEAMVNIRQTLAEARRRGVISDKVRIELESIGKELFYFDRNYRLLLRVAADRMVSETQLKRLEKWLPTNRVDQKKQDAVAMLRAMHRRLTNGLKAKQVSYSFEHTVMWESALQHSGKLRIDSNGQPSVVDLDALLDELRLTSAEYNRHCQLARERFLAIREADRLSVRIGPTRKRKTETGFRQQRQLVSAADLARWIKKNDLTNSEFEALMTEEARVKWINERAQFTLLRLIPQQLRLSGNYPALVTRANAKSRLLQSIGLNNPSLKDAGLSVNELFRWHFEKILRVPVPKNIGIHARNLGYASIDAFQRVVLKEYIFRRFRGRKLKRARARET